MRSVSAALAAAIVAPERTTRIRLSVDFDGDGHGGAGTVDDLSGKAASVTVGAVLQTTLPEQVAVVEGTAAATLSADLAGDVTDDERLDAVRYFSPLNQLSPLHGKQRLGRDVELDLEFLTAAGWQGVPLLRGVSRAMPASVAQRRASLEAIDTRARMRTLVQLPVMVADAPPTTAFLTSPIKPGLEGSWVVSYVLWQCGFPLAPPPRAGCRLYLPMHGSALPFIADAYSGSPQAWVEDTVTGEQRACRFAPGPHFLATGDMGANERAQALAPMAAGPTMFGPDGRSTGRVELWVLGDGSSAMSVGIDTVDNAAGASVLVFSSGDVDLVLFNGSTESVSLSSAVPIDGQWHFVGVHWDDAAGRVVMRIDDTSTVLAITPTTVAGLGVTIVDTLTASLLIFGGAAEIQVTAGLVEADDWLPTTYTAGAVVDRSQLRLDGIAAGEPGEGWAILQELATAEQGAVYVDADGRPVYATRARLVSEQAQTSQRTLTARADLLELAYDFALDQVRNVVTCGYSPVAVTMRAEVWSLSETVMIPPGRTHTVLISTSLATSFHTYEGSANSVSDGSGTGYAIGELPPEVTVAFARVSPTSVRLVVSNNLPFNVWLVDVEGQPDLRVIGDVAQQGAGADTPTFRNEASIAAYGEQPLQIPANRWVQTRGLALGLATMTGLDLGEPQPVLADLSIPSDPRLEYFDRLTVRDEANTGIAADFWYLGGSHRIDARGGAVQTVTGRPTRNRFLVGTGIVGQDLIG